MGRASSTHRTKISWHNKLPEVECYCVGGHEEYVLAGYETVWSDKRFQISIRKYMLENQIGEDFFVVSIYRVE